MHPSSITVDTVRIRACRQWSLAAVLLILSFWPAAVPAEWQINNDSARFTDASGAVAEITNETGYRLAIYHDSDGTIHARFSLNDRLIHLHESICPTFQVDNRQRHNTSLNEEVCQLGPRQVEYTLGTVTGSDLVSKPLYDMMNGTTIHYRFRLAAGGYEHTTFSLAGSKRALINILGPEVEVLPR